MLLWLVFQRPCNLTIRPHQLEMAYMNSTFKPVQCSSQDEFSKFSIRFMHYFIHEETHKTLEQWCCPPCFYWSFCCHMPQKNSDKYNNISQRWIKAMNYKMVLFMRTSTHYPHSFGPEKVTDWSRSRKWFALWEKSSCRWLKTWNLLVIFFLY